MTSFCIAKTKKVKVQITHDLLESSFYKAGQTVRQKVISETIQGRRNGWNDNDWYGTCKKESPTI